MSRLIDADALKNVFAGQPPEYYTTAYITDLIDRMPNVHQDDILELCRAGVMKKYVGKGVVIINYRWWREMCERDGFRPVPTPEQLKEQEPVEAKTMGGSKSHGSWWFACGACGHAIDVEDNFCRECGRPVKWNG